MKEKISKIEKKNGRPAMEEDEKRKGFPLRLMAAEKEQLMKEHQKNSPNMKLSSFIRKKLLGQIVVASTQSSLDDETKKMIKELNLFANQFNMVASRKNITFLQEKNFVEASENIRFGVRNLLNRLTELNRNQLYYFKIGEILNQFKEKLFNRIESDGLMNNKSLNLFINELENICDNIKIHQK